MAYPTRPYTAPDNRASILDYVDALLQGGVGIVNVSAPPYNGDLATAAAAAASSGAVLVLPPGDFTVSSPLTISTSMVGAGAERTRIVLTNTGQLVVGSSSTTWSGFRVTSSIDGLTFVSCSRSNWTWCEFRIEGAVGATSQVGVQFDATSNSVYFADLTVFKIRDVALPFKLVGPAAGDFQAINSCRIGASTHDDIQEFTTAYTIEGASLTVIANSFAGYLENAVAGTTKVFSVTGTANKFRENRGDFVLDNVATFINTAVAIQAPNYWRIRSDSVVMAGVGSVTGQVYATNRVRFRIHTSVDQVIGAASTFTKILFDTADFNEGGPVDGNGVPTGLFNVSTNEFTASRDMRLAVTVQADMTTNFAVADRVRLSIYKNGDEFATSSDFASTTNGVRVRVSDILSLAVGDTVSAYIWATGDVNKVVSAGTTVTYFSAME